MRTLRSRTRKVRVWWMLTWRRKASRMKTWAQWKKPEGGSFIRSCGIAEMRASQTGSQCREERWSLDRAANCTDMRTPVLLERSAMCRTTPPHLAPAAPLLKTGGGSLRRATSIARRQTQSQRHLVHAHLVRADACHAFVLYSSSCCPSSCLCFCLFLSLEALLFGPSCTCGRRTTTDGQLQRVGLCLQGAHTSEVPHCLLYNRHLCAVPRGIE